MNTPVSFKIAKVLTEKGISFNANKRHYLNVDGEEITDAFIAEKYNYNIPGHIDVAKSVWATSHIPAPIIAEVVMWIYEKHKIWIWVRINGIHKTFDYSIHSIKTMQGSLDNIENCGFTSPKDAYEKAIGYTLKNLIK